MRSRKTLFAIIFALLFSNMFAQVAVNPTDDFYQDAVSWYLKGYVESIPQLKPYPLNVIKSILEQVASCDEEKEAEKAKAYLDDFNKFIGVSLFSKADIKIKHLDESSDVKAKVGDESKTIRRYQDNEIFTEGLGVFGDIGFTDKISASYDFSFKMNNNNVSFDEVLPSYLVTGENAKMSGLSFSNSDMDFRFSPTSVAYYGNERIFGSVGFNNSAYGFYGDGSNVLSPESLPSFNATFQYLAKRFHFSQYSSLVTSRNVYDDTLGHVDKFVFFRSVWAPFFDGKLSVSYYETSVSSKEFIPFQLVPLPLPLVGKIFEKESPNIFAGVGLQYRPLPCIVITGDLYFDSIRLGELVKLNFDETASRFALKGGFIYSPYDSMCSSIVFDYNIIMPYTFTSDADSSGYNLRDYTNFGIGMGSRLPPNSDIVSLKVNFEPLPGLKIGTKTSFMRHGNSYESLTDEEVLSLFSEGSDVLPSDGSLYMSDREAESATEHTNFLTQEHLMYVIQAGVNASYEHRIRKTVGFSL